jgi:hypothetical protein
MQLSQASAQFATTETHKQQQQEQQQQQQQQQHQSGKRKSDANLKYSDDSIIQLLSLHKVCPRPLRLIVCQAPVI